MFSRENSMSRIYYGLLALMMTGLCACYMDMKNTGLSNISDEITIWSSISDEITIQDTGD